MNTFDPFAPTAKTPSLKFPAIGARHMGTITKIGEPVQCKKFQTGELEFWPSGDPIMQVPVTLQTGELDPETPDHNGEWALWARIAGTEGGMMHAIREAIKASGAKTLEVGGKLLLEYYATDPESKNPANPRKLYRAQYQAPTPGGDAFAPQAPAPQAPATQAPAPQAQAPQWTQPPAATPAQPPQPQQVWPQQQAPQAPAPQQAPQAPAPQQAPQAPAAPQYDLAQIQNLITQGQDDHAIYTQTGAPLNIIQQARLLAQGPAF